MASGNGQIQGRESAQSPTPAPRRIVLLGATGSIGRSTVDLLERDPERFSVAAVAGGRDVEALARVARAVRAEFAAIRDESAYKALKAALAGTNIQVAAGREAVIEAALRDADLVVSAIVGAAGVEPTYAALAAGRDVALANKECLVCAGVPFMRAAAEAEVRLLPMDSEHNAIFQALGGEDASRIERMIITASGGPFRTWSKERIAAASVEEALNHPNWAMGPKITVDSATLMNKALEVIEARWLFDLRPEQIEVIIHPESMIHSFVEFKDGSVVAQLSPPDMRLPIQYALTYPERVSGPARRLNWREMAAWHFEQPDHETFPALQLGYEVARRGGTCGAVLNAANEAAVGSFLTGGLAFLDIARVCRDVLQHHHYSAQPTLAELQAVDRWARQEVARWIISTHRNETAT